MITIQFTRASAIERGLTLIMDNGIVEYTEREDTFIVPTQTVSLLEKEQIPFKEVTSEDKFSAHEASTMHSHK